MSSYAGFWFLIQSTGGWWKCRQSQCTIVIIGGTGDNVTMLYCPHRWVVQVMMLKHLTSTSTSFNQLQLICFGVVPCLFY